MRQHLIISALLALSALFVIACASDDTPKNSTMDYWANKKGNCETVLKTPYAHDMNEITRCTKLWEMYRYVDDIPLTERSMYAVAFSRVSYQATDPYDRGIADAALSRICIPRHPLGSNGEVREEIPDKLECSNTGISELSVAGTALASNNPYLSRKGKIPLGEVSDRDAAAANASYKKAMAERKKNNTGKAISLYREALRQNPYHIGARYDLACALAISGDESGAIRELEELYTYDDPEAEQRLVKARSDSDFEYIRSNPNFKLITGYVRITLVNGAGAIGEPQVQIIKKKLEQRNFPIAEVGKGSAQTVPQIWYREGFDDYANQIRDTLNIRKMSVNVMRKPTTEDDILVVWGQPEAASLGLGQNAPVVTGTRAQGSDNKLDDITDSVNKNKQSVDKANQAADSLTKW